VNAGSKFKDAIASSSFWPGHDAPAMGQPSNPEFNEASRSRIPAGSRISNRSSIEVRSAGKRYLSLRVGHCLSAMRAKCWKDLPVISWKSARWSGLLNTLNHITAHTTIRTLLAGGEQN